MSIHRLTLIVTDMYERAGHDPATLPNLPGWNDLPPSRSPSASAHSPNAPSPGASSAGAGIAALTIADAWSTGTSHSRAQSKTRTKARAGMSGYAVFHHTSLMTLK
jgi:hypothetical protein